MKTGYYAIALPITDEDASFEDQNRAGVSFHGPFESRQQVKDYILKDDKELLEGDPKAAEHVCHGERWGSWAVVYCSVTIHTIAIVVPSLALEAKGW